jgi:quinolinate synthase
MPTLFEELRNVKTFQYTEEDAARFELLHEEIRELKKQRNAVIVAHN